MASKTKKTGTILEVEPKQCVISKLNSRTVEVSEERISELAESIAAQGQLQDALGRQLDSGKVEIYAGGNRLKAVTLLNQMKGKDEAPYTLRVRILEGDDKATLLRSIAENEFVNAPTVIDRANEILRLKEEAAMSQKEIAAFLHLSEASVTQTLKVLDLNKAVQKAIASGDVPAEVARILAAVPKNEQPDILKDAIEYRKWQEQRLDDLEAEEEAEGEEEQEAGEESESESESSESKPKPKKKDKRRDRASKKGVKATTEDVKRAMEKKGFSTEEGKARTRTAFLNLLDAMDNKEQSPAARRFMHVLVEWFEGGKSDSDLDKAFARYFPKEEKEAA